MHQCSYYYWWEASVKQLIKERTESAGVKGFGAVQHSENRVGPIPQVVTYHLLHQPGALSSGGVWFESKL